MREGAAWRPRLRESAQLCQVHGLFAHLHAFVQAALFGQVADALRGIWPQRSPKELNSALVGRQNAVGDADEGGFAGSVGSEEAKKAALRNLHVEAAKGVVRRVALVQAGGGKGVHASCWLLGY